MKPAPVLLEPSSESESKATPAPAFLVNLPPWHTVFLHNLSDLFRPGKDSSLHLYSRPGSFWPDVFVTSRLPWNRFAQSAICHVAFIVALWGSVQLWPQRPQVLDRPVFNRADVIYYAPSEYLPPLDTGGRADRFRKEANRSTRRNPSFQCRRRRTTARRRSSPRPTSS